MNLILGQFVQVREPACFDGTSAYTCVRNDGTLLPWKCELTGSLTTLIRASSGDVTTINVGSAVVTLTCTVVPDTSINVTATIPYSDTVILVESLKGKKS